MSNIYAKLGVRTVINCTGIVRGSEDELRRAMVD